MAILADKYRPRRLSQVLGQAKVTDALRDMGSFGGRAFWISGKSGQGKTTLARIIAGAVADDWFITEADAGSVTRADLDGWAQAMRLFALGKGGRAWIINEAHGIRRDVLRALLVMLEPGDIPAHCVFIFTTTVEGMSLFEDSQDDSSPLLSRCIELRLTSQGLAPVFSRFAARVASREGLDGQGLPAAQRLVKDRKGNLRAVLSDIEQGALRG